jgi:hypothetical protein
MIEMIFFSCFGEIFGEISPKAKKGGCMKNILACR